MIGGRYSVTQRRSRTQGMNGGFSRNALLANTALVLLGYIRGVFVVPSTCSKLLGRQTHGHGIPELVLVLILSEPHKRTTAKNQFGEIERDINTLSQRRERCPCPGSRSRSSSLSRKLS